MGLFAMVTCAPANLDSAQGAITRQHSLKRMQAEKQQKVKLVHRR
jgi:hypothetical protein